MNKWKLLLGLAVALLVVLGFGSLGLISNASTAAQTYTLDWCVVGGSGDVSTQLSGTVGQTAIGWSTGTSQLGSGFWYGVGAGGTHGVYLPLILRAK